MDNNIKREVILENYKNPYNKGLKDDNRYVSLNKSSQTCIDNFDIQVLVEDNIIKDIRYDGEACAIATSSMSIGTSILIGKTKEEALEIINNYEQMIDEKEYNKNILEELNVYEDIYKQPSRVKCATLGIEGIKELIKNSK